jgi:hypothetical protein
MVSVNTMALTKSSSVRTGCGSAGLDGLDACRTYISPVRLVRPVTIPARHNSALTCPYATNRLPSLAQADDLDGGATAAGRVLRKRRGKLKI